MNIFCQEGAVQTRSISVEQFEGMLETLEILSDPVFAKRLRKSLEEAKAGRTVGLDEAAARLGL